MLINYCGNIISSEDKALPFLNRAFAYGDSLFETILCLNGSPQLMEAHHSRLMKGVVLLKMDNAGIPTVDSLFGMITELLQANEKKDAVVRWQIFREGSELGEQGRTSFVISCRELPPPRKPGGIRIGIYRDAQKTPDLFSGLKHGNFLPYFMGAIYARENQLDDAIILNAHGRICDSCIANVFLMSKNSLFTPAIAEGCVEGIYRDRLINELMRNNMKVEETALTETMLLEADEIFLTNCIRGIIPVAWAEGKEFSTDRTEKLIAQNLC